MSEPTQVDVATLRAELSGLELRLVDRLTVALDKKADHAVMEQLMERVTGLELSRAAREHLARDVSDLKVEAAESRRFRYAVPSVAVLAFIVAVGEAVRSYLS